MTSPWLLLHNHTRIAHSMVALVTFLIPAVLLLSMSCSELTHGGNPNLTNAQASNTASPSATIESSQTETSSLEKPKAKSVRKIDFHNFSYPWYPSYLKSPTPTRELTLKNGQFELLADPRSELKNLSIQLEDVSYAKLTQNREEVAVVTLSGISIFNRFVGCIFIYSIDSQKPKLLFQHEFGDRADGGLRQVSVRNRTLVVDQYRQSEGDGGLCCPKQFVRQHFVFNGKEFQQIKSETFPNKYPNAEFLGYPDDGP